MDAFNRERGRLDHWLDHQPDDFYAADPLLQWLVRDAALGHREAALHAFGEQAAGPLDAATRENDLRPNLPRLDAWSAVGRHEAGFAVHPAYHEAGRMMYGSGMMAAYAQVPNPHRFILSLFYLSSHVGEGGHNCPLACTAGAIRALQALGTPRQRERWLPGLLDPEYGRHLAAAQFLTEVQGGSDVGANLTEARPAEDGTWRIHGEKWFCSSADADLFLMTARVPGRPEGTRGLGLFLVPRLRDGAPNGFRIRRLKDKLGTRAMLSAELDFEGSVAEALGPVERGFPNTMELVIDTSRLYNAFGCAGLAHRAYLVARTYAEHRRAFGASIARYPLVQETLSFIRADAEACLAGSFWLAGLQEAVDADVASERDRAFFRMGLNLNKVRTALLAHDAINRGIEVLGGNGTIETFSVLPRLLRDNVVFENWEGTHHTLRMQVLRDAARLGIHGGFFEVLEERLGVEPLAADREAFERCLRTRDTLLLRRLCDRLGTWLHLAALAPVDLPGVRHRATLTERRHLRGDLEQSDYGELVERCASED